ncbi:hypothetical protein ACRAWF_18000 [Streptomyces sp. L7]
MLPCVRAQGGPDPEELFSRHPLAEGRRSVRCHRHPGRARRVLRRALRCCPAAGPAHPARLPAGPGRRAALAWLRTRWETAPS